MESIVELPMVVSIEFNTVIVEIVAKLVVAVEFTTAATTVIVMLIIMLKVMLGIMLIAVIVIGNFRPRHLATEVIAR